MQHPFSCRWACQNGCSWRAACSWPAGEPALSSRDVCAIDVLGPSCCGGGTPSRWAIQASTLRWKACRVGCSPAMAAEDVGEASSIILGMNHAACIADQVDWRCPSSLAIFGNPASCCWQSICLLPMKVQLEPWPEAAVHGPQDELLLQLEHKRSLGGPCTIACSLNLWSLPLPCLTLIACGTDGIWI